MASNCRTVNERLYDVPSRVLSQQTLERVTAHPELSNYCGRNTALVIFVQSIEDCGYIQFKNLCLIITHHG